MSDEVANAISFTHALTKQLLHVPDHAADNILIAVIPREKMWTVRVQYAQFSASTEAETLRDALDEMVSVLTTSVTQQLEDGAKLLNKT